MKVFIGYDPRAAIGFNVASFSIARRASRPLSITPLILDQLPITRRGLTEFTYSRFLVPYLCGFEGWALFTDSDILCHSDVIELANMADPEFAVMAVDTNPRFERAAVMLFNCAHPDNAILTPDFIDNTKMDLFGLGWTENAGALPREWNFLVGYDQLPPKLDEGDMPPGQAIIHFTKGLPVWPETAGCDYAEMWHFERRAMCGITKTWDEFMGKSVHKVA